MAEDESSLLEFARGVAELRRNHPVFRRRRFFTGPADGAAGRPGDIAWFTPSGREMTDGRLEDRLRESDGGLPER